jgi:hypothetical protein
VTYHFGAYPKTELTTTKEKFRQGFRGGLARGGSRSRRSLNTPMAQWVFPRFSVGRNRVGADGGSQQFFFPCVLLQCTWVGTALPRTKMAENRIPYDERTVSLKFIIATKATTIVIHLPIMGRCKNQLHHNDGNVHFSLWVGFHMMWTSKKLAAAIR